MCYDSCVKLLFTVIITIALPLAGISCVKSGSGGNPDITPPSISDIRILDIYNSRGTTMAIAWRTSEPATSQVEYGRTTEYGLITPLDENLVINHGATLGGITANSLYHFRVRSKDAAGNEAMSEDKTYMHSTIYD